MLKVRYRNYIIMDRNVDGMPTFDCEELALFGYGTIKGICSAIDSRRLQNDLTLAFKEAEEAALRADPCAYVKRMHEVGAISYNGMESVHLAIDGWSCNHDTPVINLPGVRMKTVKAAADEAGVRVDKKGPKGEWWVFVTMNGQANRRTVMAEAARDAMKLHGFNAKVWYKAD